MTPDSSLDSFKDEGEQVVRLFPSMKYHGFQDNNDYGEQIDQEEHF